MMKNYKSLINNTLKPYSAILFLNNKVAGLFLLLITFINPSIAISGMIAVVFTVMFAKLIELDSAYLSQGFYLYNSLLVGMGIGFIFEPTLISVLLIAIASSFTFMFSFMLNRIFSVYKIPILSLPFSIVTMFLYLASLKYSGLLSSLVNNATIYDIELPLIVSSFFQSFGTIFFLHNNIAGILMILLVLFFSRIIVIMAIVGFYFGVLIHSVLLGSFEQALYDPYAFNYILVAIALCGIFLLPTIKNFLLALIGVAISVVLTDAIGMLFQYYSIPVFTIPFNLTVITFIFILSIVYYKEFNTEIKQTPEKSLSNYLSKIFRFGKSPVRIALPFIGSWDVYQAFDDEWTHKAEYKYAYDFVKIKDEKTYKNDGLHVEDYFAFSESILSPVSGYVVDSRHDLCDNIIGEVDRINNWGNYIIIKSDLGFFVEISHLMQFSINVNVGDYVKVNSIIAKCGNSGYSPEPHIHIQVQDLGVIGGFTKEFFFTSYVKDEELKLNTIPKKHELISSTINDRSINSRLLFILEDSLKYEVFKDDVFIENITFIVKMDENSEFYFEDEKDNKLYFYNDSTQFYFYNYIGNNSYLKQIFILAPRIPFISMQKVFFVDYLPIYLVKSRFESAYTELLSTINKEFYKLETTYSFDGVKISSDFGELSLEPFHKGFTDIKYNNISLGRIL